MGLFDGLRDDLSFFGGFKVTLRADDATSGSPWQYPPRRSPSRPRSHGRHVLNRYEDGMEKCIGCELCAGVCPADCIYVRGADNPPDDPVSPGERYGFVYEINYLRCIHCDLCVEACPTEAITETKLFEFSFTNRADAIYTKDELLVGDDGRPQHLPWEDWRDGRRPAHLGLDAGHVAVGQRRLRGPGAVVGRARLRRARPRGRPERRTATTPPPASAQLRETFSRASRRLGAAARPAGAAGRANRLQAPHRTAHGQPHAAGRKSAP